MATRSLPVVHRFRASLLPVNAYVVEFETGVVVVDSTLGVSDGRALGARVDALAKPLRAVLVTHAHPDHYGALTALLEGRADVPVVATAGVAHAIARDDPAKEQILRPMFGDEWARARTFPTRTAVDGERLTFDGATFRVIDLGPGESPHDSLWVLDGGAPGGSPRAFVGDLVYAHMHGYLADGHYAAWLRNIERVRRELPPDTLVYMGHGEPGPAGPLLDWQAEYIRRFVAAVRAAGPTEAEGDAPSQAAAQQAITQTVTQRMQAYLPSDDLLFLMQLSVPPMRERLAADA